MYFYEKRILFKLKLERKIFIWLSIFIKIDFRGGKAGSTPLEHTPMFFVGAADASDVVWRVKQLNWLI